MLSVFKRAEQYDQRLAVIDKDQSYSYEELIKASNTIASALLSEKLDLYEERIGFLIPPSFNYVSILWGIWKAGGIGVPLSLSATESELSHYLEDTKVSLLISNEEGCKKLKKLLDNLNIPLKDIKNLQDS